MFMHVFMHLCMYTCMCAVSVIACMFYVYSLPVLNVFTYVFMYYICIYRYLYLIVEFIDVCIPLTNCNPVSNQMY